MRTLQSAVLKRLTLVPAPSQGDRPLVEEGMFGQLQGMLRGDALLGTRSLHAAFSARDVIRDRRDA